MDCVHSQTTCQHHEKHRTMSKYDIPLNVAQQWHRQRFGKHCRVEGRATRSPCPGCGGTDRFKIWPAAKDPNIAAFHCFHCGLDNGLLQDIRDEIRGGKPTEMNIAPRTKRMEALQVRAPHARRQADTAQGNDARANTGMETGTLPIHRRRMAKRTRRHLTNEEHHGQRQNTTTDQHRGACPLRPRKSISHLAVYAKGRRTPPRIACAKVQAHV